MKYKVYSKEEAEDFPDAYWKDDLWCQDDYFSALYEHDEEGKPVRLLGTDNMEPEDNTFGRDWSWVEVELNKAFEKGKNFAQNTGDQRNKDTLSVEDLNKAMGEIANKVVPNVDREDKESN